MQRHNCGPARFHPPGVRNEEIVAGDKVNHGLKCRRQPSKARLIGDLDLLIKTLQVTFKTNLLYCLEYLQNRDETTHLT